MKEIERNKLWRIEERNYCRMNGEIKAGKKKNKLLKERRHERKKEIARENEKYNRWKERSHEGEKRCVVE